MTLKPLVGFWSWSGCIILNISRVLTMEQDFVFLQAACSFHIPNISSLTFNRPGLKFSQMSVSFVWKQVGLKSWLITRLLSFPCTCYLFLLTDMLQFGFVFHLKIFKALWLLLVFKFHFINWRQYGNIYYTKEVNI